VTLDDLQDDIEATYSEFTDSASVGLDRETKHELAMLATVFGTEDEGELFRRALHTLFQTTVQSGDLDFHLRQGYDVTYDEYLAGMTYEEMTGANQYPERDDVRRYQM
jgi:hypothetical protein